MFLRPYSVKKINQSITNTLSPKGIKKPTYSRLKGNKEKETKTGRSLCSGQTYRQSSSLTNRRMLSHRKLISVSSLEHRQNLTDRKAPSQSLKQNKFTTLQNQNSNHKAATLQPKQSFRQKPHINKFARRSDRLYTIQNNDEVGQQNIQKVLQIKQNILKQFIDRFQEQLRGISQKKNNSITVTKTLLTNRKYENNNKQSLVKQQTTKKPRLNSIVAAASLQSNRSTVNLGDCLKSNKQNISFQHQNIQKSKFQEYIKSLKDHRKKDQKIFIMKNHKRSLQSISISRIGDTQNLLTNRVNSKIDTKAGSKSNRMNLKELFKHSKKYEPYLRQGSTLTMFNNNNPGQKIEETIQQKSSKLERSSSLIESPILRKNQNHCLKDPTGDIDCSSIQKMNQSSFISQMGRNSLLKHLQKQTSKLVKQENRKTKKCLTKIKSIFPANFF